MPDELEIDAAEFAAELRDGVDVTVLDTRSPEAFKAWHVQPRRGRTLNLGERDVPNDLERVRALVADGSPLRVICTAGNASQRVTAILAEHGIQARSVRGGMAAWSNVLQSDEVLLPGRISVVQFRREARGCLSYLLCAGGEAWAVDPASAVDAYVEAAARRGARIVRVFDTHIHADHVSGARELAERTGALLSLSSAALRRGVRYGERVTPVVDGEQLSLGGADVSVVALPGHTSDMTGLLLGSAALVGGDALFVDTVARPDLETGDEGARDAARQLYRTLHGRIGSLRESILLLPCHYAGGRLDSALAIPLGAVWDQVAELWLDEDTFVGSILAELPAKPANFGKIIAINLGDQLPAAEVASLEVGGNNCAVKAQWADVGAAISS